MRAEEAAAAQLEAAESEAERRADVLEHGRGGIVKRPQVEQRRVVIGGFGFAVEAGSDFLDRLDREAAES